MAGGPLGEDVAGASQSGGVPLHPVSKTAKHLRATSDRLLRDLDALATMEHEKRNLEPDDPRLVEMAARIEDVARRVLGTSRTQYELTERVQQEFAEGAPDASVTPIVDTPRDLATILEHWRESERRLAAAEPGSVEATEAQILVDHLRREYQDAHRDATG